MFWHIKNFASDVTKRTCVPPPHPARVHRLLVSAQVTNESKSFSTHVAGILLVLVLIVHHPNVTWKVGHKGSANVTSVFDTIVLHLLVHLHLSSVAAREATHITLEWPFLVVALFNVDGQIANLDRN